MADDSAIRERQVHGVIQDEFLAAARQGIEKSNSGRVFWVENAILSKVAAWFARETNSIPDERSNS